MERRVFDWVEHVTGDYRRKPDVWSYTHLRLFHGCRPVDVQTYYEHGILLMPKAVLADQLRTIFQEVSESQIQAAVAKVTQRDTVDTALDLRYLKEHASHYIVQGSETLKAFAVYLPRINGKDPSERLKNVGVPTALVVEAPLEEIDYQTLEELDEKLRLLAESGTYEVCDEKDMIDFTVSFSKGVPREWIIRHEIIREATDPADCGKKYRYP